MTKLRSAWLCPDNRVRRNGLLVALVLAVLAAATVQSLLGALVAQRTSVRDATIAVAGEATSLERALAAHDGDPVAREVQTWLDAYVAGHDVVAARLVDARGRVEAVATTARRITSSPPDATGSRVWDSFDHWQAGSVTGPSARWADKRLHVTVPLSAGAVRAVRGGALQVVFDGEPLASRAGALQRLLVAVVGVGGLVTITLWLLMAGRAAGWRPGSGSEAGPDDGTGAPRRREVAGAPLDEVSGVPGRSTFVTHLEQAVAWSDRTQETLTLALVDLNDVADVRDCDGRRAADRLIQEAAELLLTCSEHVYRVAGDGFAVLLTGSTPAVARAMVEGVAGDIAQQAAPLTADVAVVQLDRVVAPDAHSLLIRAETELADTRERRAFAQAHIMIGLEHLVPGPERWDMSWLDEA